MRTEVNIDWMRLLSYGAIQNFLHGIALHVCNADHDTNEYLQTCIGIDRALTRTLWQTQTIMQSDLDDQSYGELDLQLEGSARVVRRA